MKREIWLEPVRRSRRHLSMVFGIDDLSFETAYWYNSVDFYALEDQYGKELMEKFYFHLLLFEANKLWSLKPATINLGTYARFHTIEFEKFWREINHRAWAEWRYDENLPFYQGPAFTSEPIASASNPVELKPSSFPLNGPWCCAVARRRCGLDGAASGRQSRRKIRCRRYPRSAAASGRHRQAPRNMSSSAHRW